MPTKPRSRVKVAHPFQFLGRIVVDCPRCGGAAIIVAFGSQERPDGRQAEGVDQARRMVCEACSHVIDQPLTPYGQSANPTLGLTLRLRAETRHGDLVAINEAHLDYLEAYLSGVLREEQPDPTGWLRNGSIISRLPAWAKAAKNREEVLKAIGRARLKAPSPAPLDG